MVGLASTPGVEEITGASGLEALAPEWSSLWARCPAATPFQAPEWLVPWWRHFHPGELWALALRDEGRLVGLVPFCVHARREPPARTVLLVGTGNTDHLDGLAEPGHERSVAEAVFAHLDRRQGRWDSLDLHQLAPGSPFLDASPPADWLDQTYAQEPCPVLTLPGTEEGLASVLPARQREKLRYYRKRAEKIGPVRVETANRDNLPDLFDAFLRLHGARWSSVGLPGVLSDADVQHFHRDATGALLQAGMLRLYALRIGECVAAVYYGFLARRRAYFYLAGFDPELSRISPGLLVVGHAIQEAVRERAVEFDFLRGREAYKYRWGARDRTCYRRYLGPGAASGGYGREWREEGQGA